MALAPLGLLDLSIITDRLVRLLRECRDASEIWAPPGPPFQIDVTGSSPDSVREDGNCQLSLYLFHVTRDKYQTNTAVTPPRLPAPPSEFMRTRVPVVPFHPLSLDLYYLLTAYAQKDYVQEQQAMSIALKCFHENPIVRTNVTIGAETVPQEFSVTMEVETADELGRLWQSVTTAARLSVVYKVGVVFVTPEAPTTTIAPPPTKVVLTADPTSLPYAREGQVLGTVRTVTYRSPDLTVTPQPDMRSFEQSPATVAPGDRFLLLGAGLNQDTSKRVYLLMPDGTEIEVTSWVVPDAAPTTPPNPLGNTSSRLVLELPQTVGAAPADTPPAGVYQLRVGSDTAAGDATTYRSNATPFSIAALVSVSAGPPPAPLLTPAGSVYTFQGLGLVAGRTEVLLDTLGLAEAGAVGPGKFTVSGPGDSISLELPAGLPPGLYTVRVRVNNVESAPRWWIRLP